MNTVISKTTGAEFPIVLDLRNNGKGANWSKIVVAGEPRHADWFVSKTGELSCLCTFYIDDEKCELNAVANKIGPELTKWVEMVIERRRKDQEDQENARLGQEYNY